MAGIDYTSASVAMREPFMLTADQVKELLPRIRGEEGIDGCVLLSTCNRTELYLSCAEGARWNAALLLCEKLSLSEQYSALFTLRTGRQALAYLMMVAAGLCSQLRGEDQVLGQVKAAICMAREVRCADAVLETAFRLAVSAGKKAKTDIPLCAVETSTAHRALEVLRQAVGSMSGKRVLVIGNGEMGRLSAALFVSQGCEVTMTLRSYKRGAAIIPTGCDTIAYTERYELIPHCDIVVSATASPHFTLRAEDLHPTSKAKQYFVDLAVPRDVDPVIAGLEGVGFWDIDALGGGTLSEETEQKLTGIKEIIDEFLMRFDAWEGYRSLLPVNEKQGESQKIRI